MHRISVYVCVDCAHFLSLQILEKAAEIVGSSDCMSMVSRCIQTCRTGENKATYVFHVGLKQIFMLPL